MNRTSLLLVGFLSAICVAQSASRPTRNTANEGKQMSLGNFSVSLSVKDLEASHEFYEKLGFRVVFGNLADKMVIMQNETSTIGLFHGMFEKNMLTYNPGWDRDTKTLADFDDVRDIQKMLKERGIVPVTLADESTTGPASLLVMDPDGNPILIDQHVPSPKKKAGQKIQE